MKDKAIISVFILVLFIYMLIGNTLVLAHGEGGREEAEEGSYLIELAYSEKPLNTYESILFTLSLRNSTTGSLISFSSMQLSISDSKKKLIRVPLSPEFKGRVTFTYRFPYEDAFLIEAKFNEGLRTIVETEFILYEFIPKNKQTSKETELSVNKNGAVEILITDEGFKPKKITISKGTTVIWKNVGNNFHWPASDFHPTHREYPTDEQGCLGSNFDACTGLKKNQDYSFTLDKLGSWGVHDHLYPGLTMQINVINSDLKKKQLLDFFPFRLILALLNNANKMENTIEVAPDKFLQLPVPEQRNYMETLSTEDSEAAWKYLKDAFIVNGRVIGNAHELSHIVGNAIQTQHGVKGILKCDPAFGFGCYHGVTEKLLTEYGIDIIKEIESQCMSLFPPEKGGEAPSCIHGIGHGLLTINGLNIDKSLNDCDLLQIHNRRYCYDGVFMENSFSSVISFDANNLWEFCTDFDEKYHASCATYHVTQILSYFKGKISALANACETAPNPVIYQKCYRKLGFRVSQISQGDIQSIRHSCSLVDNNMGKDTCTIFAAVDTIFQGYSGWQQTYKSLCSSLIGNAAQNCLAHTKQTIKTYNRVESDSNSPQTAISLDSSTARSSIKESPEITEIKKFRLFSKGSDIYRKLIVRVGPQQAQEELYRSGLPFSGETHLLNHVPGKYLYENFGPSGLIQCEDYFLSSCYHGFTIELIADEGLSGINKVLDECQKKGSSVLSQCMHAIGHGFVSWVGYSQLDKALELCDEVGLQNPNVPLYNCYDGAFMENVWGVHDGVPSPDRWVDKNDPLYPCYDSRIDPKYRLACLGNTARLMSNTFKNNLTKSGELCLSIVNSSERKMCFDGLARHIHPKTFDNIDKIYELCSTMPENWTNFCVTRIATAVLYVGGRQIPFKICNRINESHSDMCYGSILNSLKSHAADASEYYESCDKIQNPKWQGKCIIRAGALK